jgi:hypothetical protein
MSKLDEKFVSNLQNFALALENIVDILKDKAKKGGEAGATDNVNSMLGGMNQDTISHIVSELEDVKKGNKQIKNNTDKILSEVKAARKAKESGMFDKVQDSKNKKKIVDGISVIMLIAGGVLAIGLAFKIVGKVDFLSVIALSSSILLMAKAFISVASMKDLTVKKVLITGLALVVMATALLAASIILTNTPPLNLMQMVTLIAVGIAIGIATFAVIKGMSKFQTKDKWLIPIIPLFLPAIAGGVYLSAIIFKNLPVISLMQLLTAVLIGVALIPISFAFSLLVKGLKDIKWETLVFAAAAIPLIAGVVLAASFILQYIQNVSIQNLITAALVGVALIPISFAFALLVKGLNNVKWETLIYAAAAIPVIAGVLVLSSYILSKINILNNPGDIILTSLSIGLSTLALVPTFVILAKSKLTAEGLIFGALSILAISAVIMASSYILGAGNYSNYPPLEWAAGVGIAMIVFLPAVVAMGLVIESGLGVALIGGMAAILGIAALLVGTSLILNYGNYSNYPTMEWSAGVGLSMLAFIVPMLALGGLILASAGIGALILAAGGLAILGIASLIVKLSDIFSATQFTAYPSLDWVNGVSGALTLFTEKIANMSFGLLDFIKVKAIANAIVDMGNIFNDNAGAFSQPSAQWVNNIQTILNLLNNMPDSSKANGMNAIISSISKMATVGTLNILPIMFLSSAINSLSDSLNNLNTDGVDKLMKLSGGVMVLSLVDQVKLNQVIDTLDNKKNQISSVLDEKSSSFIDTIMSAKNQFFGGTAVKKNQAAEKATVGKQPESEETSVLKEISSKLDKISTKLDKIDRANTMDTGLR